MCSNSQLSQFANNNSNQLKNIISFKTANNKSVYKVFDIDNLQIANKKNTNVNSLLNIVKVAFNAYISKYYKKINNIIFKIIR